MSNNNGYKVGDIHPKPHTELVLKRLDTLFKPPRLPSRLKPAPMFRRPAKKLGAKQTRGQLLQLRVKQVA